MTDPIFSVGIYTLGCKVNQYESEALAELFTQRGASIRPPEERCDCYVINTCTVTAESDRKARQFVRRAIHENPDSYILVTGCLSQTAPEQLTAIAGVDYVCGNRDKTSVVDAAFRLREQGQKNAQTEVFVTSLDGTFEKMKISRFDRTRAYIKIEDGCENHCTYCIIPAARGQVRSKAPEDVLEEIRTLTEGGCREVVLTGIETASYGKDLGNGDLSDLLVAADKLPGIGRIRLGSLDPSYMKQTVVDRLAGLGSLAPHFHLSLQSGSSRVLATMKRKYNADMAMDCIRRIRDAIPGVQFTTDIIVGFPGETDEDFAQTVAFVREARFLMLHVFPYSRRTGTLAAAMPDQVPEAVKRARTGELIRIGAEIRAELLTELTEKHPAVEVLFESYEDGHAFGHTPSFVEVSVPSPVPLHGELHTVRLDGTDGSVAFGTRLN